MPADVITAVRKVRAGRIEDVALTPPADMDPDDTGRYARWLGHVRRQIADGQEPPAEPYPATRAIGELRGVVKALPPVPLKPPQVSAEHDARMAEVRAELDAKRAAMHETETETETEPATEGANA
jgi:hypothetical protein